MSLSRLKMITLLFCLDSLAACSAIKVETGQTHDEAIASADREAKQIRAQFAERMRQSSASEKAIQLIEHVDSVAARYITFGYEVAQQWRQGNDGRGTEIPPAEMRDVVAAWTERQQPILLAWEDNLEYGLGLIKESGRLGEEALGLLDSLADAYYQLYSTVVFPSGTVDEYEVSVDRSQSGMAAVSARCRHALERYR